MDLVTVLTRLVAAAASAVSVPARTISAYDYVPDDVEPPCVYPESVSVEFDQTMGRGLDKVTVRLRLLCARTDDREGQHMLYGLMAGAGVGSVKAAIEAARGAPGVGALAGACHDLHVNQIGEARWFDVAAGRMVGVDFTVEVWGAGT